jgi:hypothetical protein
MTINQSSMRRLLPAAVFALLATSLGVAPAPAQSEFRFVDIRGGYRPIIRVASPTDDREHALRLQVGVVDGRTGHHVLRVTVRERGADSDQWNALVNVSHTYDGSADRRWENTKWPGGDPGRRYVACAGIVRNPAGPLEPAVGPACIEFTP